MTDLVAWVSAHAAVLAGVGVAVLDLAFALSPKVDSNGLLHAIYLQLKKLTGGKPPASL